ncbi:hypothetical protein [Pedobacter foliorum]|uniref:hypothetical protein n=1 Tax=Pedobacter foliorum TaxID=2739058 RepID=UPI001563B338|nr:hypothetical protein [Pedobacter foliorum]NRF37565.1 hypothetical protein [Pedobacter foliorum]
MDCIDEYVGIMVFSKDNTIELCKAAQVYNDKLDILAMIKTLRKDEYLQLVSQIAGEIPKATPVQLFKTCVNLLSEYPVLEVHAAFLRIIKQRINPCTNDLIQQSEIPEALRLSCYYHNLDQNDYINLVGKLSYQI